MNKGITIGLDIAKNVFQVHGIDCAGDVIIRRQLRRRQVLPFFKKPARPLGPLQPPAHPLCRQPEPRRLRPGADHAQTGRTSVANKSLSVP